MSGERGHPGERGAKGDHGQHGDTGDAGDTGQVGDRGIQGERGPIGVLGDTGERGPRGDVGSTGSAGSAGAAGERGMRGSTNWLMLGLIFAACAGGFWAFQNQNASQQRAVARTTRQNCQQIELVKGQIRGTVQASVKRLPTISYYRKRPAELKQAISDAEASVARFAPVDCRRLPAVRSATPSG